MIMEGNQNPIFNTMKASLTRPSWAILLLIFAVLTLFTLQITNKSVFPIQQSFSLAARDSSTGFRGPKSCSGFFDEVPPRKVVKSIEEFGGVGDGKTSNTAAFRTAMAYMDRFKDRGGAQLNVPKGRWLTGNFNLTSNFTLFLDEGAVILGSQDPKEWPIIEPLPSYGRGRERQGGRHISLIHGNTIRNVVITGNRSNRCTVTKIKRLNHRIDHHLLSVTYNQLNPQ